jgi:CRP/FNR family transcriptional regulator, cyclic AMP receptor protein
MPDSRRIEMSPGEHIAATGVPAGRDDHARYGAECHQALRRARLFSRMGQFDTDAIAHEFQTIPVDRGQVIFREGSPGSCLYVVLSGKVKLGRSASDGRKLLTSLLGPSDLFGELSLFDPGPRSLTATVVTDGQLACLPARSLRNWIQQHPRIASSLLRGLSQRIKDTDTMLSDLVLVDVAGRLAKVLLRLGDTFGTSFGDDIRVEHDLTQEELAQLVGASRETVNKELHNFETRGWISVEVKCVVIRQPDRLLHRAR